MMPGFSESLAVRFSVCLFGFAALYGALFAAPSGFPAGRIIDIPPGTTIGEAAALLKNRDAIQWPFLFSLAVRAGADKVVAGPYLLSSREDLLTLAFRVSHGQTGLEPVKVTLPEGLSTRQMGDILKKRLQDFDEDAFLTLAKPEEGYLFPDTYFFLPGVSPQDVIARLKANFDERTKALSDEIAAFGKPESDIIIMASILEKEGRTPETRRTIAGILWKRLKLGMPLQVDAAFGYIFGKDTYSPSGADLDVDSPYNTYKYRGLPPGPIDNPGVESIEDAVTPIATPYLYYVTDKDGNIYYAKTLDQHIQNIKKAG
jgi:UPF0755 protein